MHEYSIVAALLENVEKCAAERAATRVHRLTVRVGELAGVDVDLLKTAFAMVRERSICDGAELLVQRVAAEWRCPRCDRAIERGATLRCSECELPARLFSGDEIILDRIELEVSHV